TQCDRAAIGRPDRRLVELRTRALHDCRHEDLVEPGSVWPNRHESASSADPSTVLALTEAVVEVRDRRPVGRPGRICAGADLVETAIERGDDDPGILDPPRRRGTAARLEDKAT